MASNTKHIIQIFDNSCTYLKNTKSFEDRKRNTQWKTAIKPKSGFVEKNTLTINRDALKNPILGNTILLIDYNRNTEPQTLGDSENICSGEIILSPFKWKMFKFRKKETIELILNWSYWEIGMPERTSFKLCDLKKGFPVEIKINGKRDFSMTSRRERTFVEKNYILEYLGKVNEIKLLDNSKFEAIKRIPTNRKVVDLLKVLR